MVTRLLNAEEVAGQLGVELDTLYRYARSGQIRGVKIGKLWRFAEPDVDAFVQSHRYVSPAGSPAAVSRLADLLEAKASGQERTGGLVIGGARIGFAEINRRACRLTAALIERGIQPGDRVLVLLPNCAEFLVACIAVWKTRAILVAEYSAIRPANLLHVLGDAQPAAWIIDNSVAEKVEQLPEAFAHVRSIFVKDRTFTLSGIENVAVESLDAVLESPLHDGRTLPERGAPDEVVSISYTSGSTGMPKGVMHTHESTLAGAEFTRAYHEVAANDSIVLPLPLHHGLAFRQILAYAMADATIILASDVYQALRLLKSHRPTALVLVPAAANLILDHFGAVLADADSHLRYIEVGSAAIAPERLMRLREALPNVRIHLPYGLTEARVGFLERGSDGNFNRIAAVATGLELRLVDAAGDSVKPGETGEIVLRGKGLMKGYRGQSPEEWAGLKAFGFRTGDMGRLNKSDEIELLGRLDAMLKVGGRKVNPSEVELAMSRHPGVAEAAVAGVPDPKGVFELELHAFIVPRKDAKVSEEEILEHCRRHIEPYKLPARIHFRNSLPRSAVGKILRGELTNQRAAG